MGVSTFVAALSALGVMIDLFIGVVPELGGVGGPTIVLPFT